MNQNTESGSNQSVAAKGSGCTNTSCCPPSSPFVRATSKVGRNDPCICGNGRKYKKCCGKNA
ncbi:SEC-C motif containing protein [Paraglaciecola sp. T6c]|uniref:SEC-C metal-binding domain-containing protein n=1 Tax=Pseudoalteromonas atlantica (strain T6c / ATCC BAA-1087) TaxID=3042615 RepID=UPI0000DA6E27|nr:SEC-C motif containing protein [Paraglaciecola sp. T6c]